MSFIFFRKRCKRVKPSDYCNKSKQKKTRSSRSRSSKSQKCSSRSTKKKRCARPGRVTNNPFLNFLREFRKKHCGWSITKVAVEGAKAWCAMDPKSKEKYYREACGQMGKKRNKSKSRRIKVRSGRGKVRSGRGKCRSGRSKVRSRRSRGRSCAPCGTKRKGRSSRRSGMKRSKSSKSSKGGCP
ncbi:unnamed protein product [Phaedon cochleariae]|uniref:Protamine-like n=1 Tax=Phaedon cochleariae TaxID=80249 RepID=A0A9P0DCR6_PHACE|nr:unnamed protein product [Phaedon cochleariae]